MRVRRSLTIKQMAMVSTVAVVFIFVFIVIQLFYFVQQNRNDTVARMENMANSVRVPLAQAVLNGDITQAEEVLNTLNPAGIISRIDVVLPDQFQALGLNFVSPAPVPSLAIRIFDLPVEVSLPLYALEQHGHTQPLAYLVLQADPRSFYRFIISTLSTLLTAYLLLALILTVSISWCLNRLVVHPIRKIAYELSSLTQQNVISHQLHVSRLHQDDEIGMLVRSYNSNQRLLAKTYSQCTELLSEIQFLALLEGNKKGALLIVSSIQQGMECEALNSWQHHLSRLNWREQAGRLLSAAVTESVMVAQLNNDSFGLFIADISDPWIAMKQGQQLMNQLDEAAINQSIEQKSVICIGIAMFSQALSARDVYQRAVAATLSASQCGGNQIQFFESLNPELAVSTLAETSSPSDTLLNGEFAIWLQPQVDMQSGKVVGAEVLLRQLQSNEIWCLPEGLIERIEDCGLMVKIGGWVLEETCRVLASWQQRGIMMPLSVNLSVLQLIHKDMVPTLLSLLERYEIKPKTLAIEVTESRRIDDPQAAARILRPLHDAGVHIALDDFGMGYGCLRDLHHMKSVPVDVLKIDKSFIEEVPGESAMVEIIITMANTLGLKIIAEGVETEEQRAWLLAHGVTHAQGYLFSQAQPVTTFESQYLSSGQ